MQRPISALAAALMFFHFAATPAIALDLSGQSRSYLQYRENADSSKLLPFFEYPDLRADNSPDATVSFRFGGWLRYDLKDDSAPDQNRNGDLQYAYLSLRADRADAVLDLGRLTVREGSAVSQLDGAYARTSLKGGFGVAAFGGSPVETLTDTRRGDSVYGGRISQGVEDIYRVGVSYLQEKNNSEDIRKEEGVDLWFRPFSVVEVLGTSSYNAITDQWMYHSYYLTLGPFAGLRLSALGSKVSYADFFTASTNSAFKFDPAIIDPKETRTMAGGEAAYTFLKDVTLSADGKKYTYDIAGDADYYGGKFAWSAPGKGGMGMAWHRMDGATDSLRYDEYRAYLTGKFGRFDLTADHVAVRYAVEINGIRNAFASVLAGGYNITSRARVAADVEYGHNPFYDKDVRGLVKFVYNFDIPGTAGRKTR